jgi:hypothetical protein
MHRNRSNDQRAKRNAKASQERWRYGWSKDKDRVNYIGIDGEGVTINGEHNYIMLAASNESGSQEWLIEAEEGGRLTTVQCLDLILELPTHHARVFSFSFNYDLTKILEDLDDESLYKLMRPELRARKRNQERGPWPVPWGGYKLNLQGTKFTVRKGGKRVVIWDLFKFFGTKFTNVLKDWKIGDDEFITRMVRMKEKRGHLELESRLSIREYCLSECRSMATLGKKLVGAHNDAGLTLKSYYGAGSSGAAMLSAMGIESKIVDTLPEMKEAVASAFFGGRFENSIVGPVTGVVHGWDISSAYPYQLYFLPCLEHGHWRHTYNRDDIEYGYTALIRYRLNLLYNSSPAWAPFPFRTQDGSICYPSSSGGGWVWRDEYLAGERFAPNQVEFREAWVYECSCKCRPFAKIAEYYVQRCIIGKDAKGIVIKLGCNSCYGKLAQSVGNGRFNNWIWAGLITSGCRAQILELLMAHKDRSNALMIATDGLYTREEIEAPIPYNTGTNMLIHGVRKPLGGWEYKRHERGVFVARPGIYFPLEPTPDDIKDVRARGVGKGIVLENWRKIIDEFERNGINNTVSIANVSRFCGAKTSISRSGNPEEWRYKRANGKGQEPRYGQWVQRKIEMSFDPMPKRAGVAEDGQTLLVRSMPQDLESVPYKKALQSREAMEMKLAELIMLEQPDADVTDILEEAT